MKNRIMDDGDRIGRFVGGGAILLLIALVLIVCFFMNGRTTVVVERSEKVEGKSLSCVGDNLDYPFFIYGGANSSQVKVNLMYNSSGLRSIGLYYKMYYDDEVGAATSENHNHASMNMSFGKDGLLADAFSARYSKDNTAMAMSIYANRDDIAGGEYLKYFMADGLNIDSTIQDFKDRYSDLGFECTDKE